MDVPAAQKPAAPSADFAALGEEEEPLPRPAPAMARPVVYTGPSAYAAPVAPTAPVAPPANRMEQVEMFERKAEAAAGEDGLGARVRDPRAESIAKAQHIARSLGVSSLTDDEYDIPTFIRRQQQNNSTLN